MKRILHVLPQFQPGGGMERVVMNYFNNLDYDRFQFDIIAHKIDDDTYAKQIEAHGGKVYLFTPVDPKSMKSNGEQYQKILESERYDAVHCHMANAAFLYLRIAQQNHIPLRILHSHQDHYADTKLHSLRNIPLVALGKRYANRRVACSYASGKFLFGSEDFVVIKNGIDFRLFHFDAHAREAVRGELHVQPDTLLIGQIGRLVPQKNPLFSIRVFHELQKYQPNTRLIFAGDGALRTEAEHLCHDLQITDKVSFLGNIDYVNNLYNALDALLMPSLYEGVGLSLLEAQTSGLPSLASDSIPPEAYASKFAKPYSLTNSPAQWAQALSQLITSESMRQRRLGAEQLRQNGYDARECTKQIEAVYLS